MSDDKGGFGLSPDSKARLLERLTRRAAAPESTPAAVIDEAPARAPLGDDAVRREMQAVREIGRILQIDSPYFRPFSARAGATAEIAGRNVSNFSAYDYLGLNGHPRVIAEARAALDRHGMSVSGSRLMAGERPVHGALEAAVADIYRAEQALVLVSGHATNVTVIGGLVGAEDAVVYDSLAHNSIVQGAVLSGARRRAFAHNDLDDLQRVLHELRGRARRILVVVEGLYSMDGDVPDLPRLIPLVRRFGAYLMVDEAHALGVLGPRGYGSAEHLGVDPSGVDVWMGTFSKTLASCGGYVAGSAEIVDYLRHSAPGFVYSVGMPAPVAAAALAALEVMRAEPERVARLQANGRRFLDALKARDLDTAAAVGAAVAPVVVGSSLRTVMAADALWKAGVAVNAVHYPAVPERTARLRFFVTADHAPDELERVAGLTAEAIAAARVDPALLAQLAGQLGGARES